MSSITHATRELLNQWRAIPRFTTQWRAIPPPTTHEFERLCTDLKISNSVKLIFGSTSDGLALKVAYARSLEVKKLFQDYFVFNHGQATTSWVPFALLNRKLLLPPESTIFETTIRNPTAFSQEVHCRNPRWYQKRINPRNLYEHSDRTYKELIAADGYLASRTVSESALHFFQGYTWRERGSYPTILRDSLSTHIQDVNQREHFISEFNQLNAKASKKGGVLYTICISKKEFFDCGYLSWGFGIPYEDQSERCLEAMQQEEEMIAKKYAYNSPSGPQVRLLAHKLKGSPVFMFSTMADREISDLSFKINSLCDSFDIGYKQKKSTQKVEVDHASEKPLTAEVTIKDKKCAAHTLKSSKCTQ